LWGSDVGGSAAAGFSSFIAGLKDSKEYERAAAICAFNQRYADASGVLADAIRALDNQKDSPRVRSLEMACLALAGYQAILSASAQTFALWADSCKQLIAKDQHPYMRAMFFFLQSRSFKDLEQVLRLTDVSLRDRVAFACCFLNSHELATFVAEETRRAVREGDLDGILLSGLYSPDGVELLQKYIDTTGDVQTACLVGLLAYLPEKKVPRGNAVERWVASYRALLNRWKLWEVRARLDGAIQPLLDRDPPAQVFARCGFCSKPLSARPGGSAIGQMGPAAKMFVSYCPECRKALPRCSVCLLPLDVAVVGSMRSAGVPGREFESWWSWCQSCGHGGHAQHLTEWFATHRICPVTDCPCCCCSKDPLY
jgi:uncharacterized protein with PIN domain